MDQKELALRVEEVLDEVRSKGDEAILDFTERWDGVKLSPQTLRVPQEAIANADIDNPFGEAFQRAAERIRRFHQEVKPRSTQFEDEEGNRLGMRWTPIRSVGLYVPGGKASYPSTLAMTFIPAQIAGVERIVVVSPPGPNGEVSDQVLMAAKVLGVDEIYRVGGAQAVGALAFGTENIPKVDKIFGPGNAFVAEAKKQVYGEVGIDLLAGPSEVVVVADESSQPRWVASDLMAQAEHDEDTCCTLLATSEGIVKAVRQAIAELIEEAPRKEVITKSFENNGNFLSVDSLDEAADRLNEIAPEHLSIQVEDPWGFLAKVRNAGAIFIGRFSPVAVGDYYAGPNHVLPTGRTARFASCLSVEDFMKRSNVCQASEAFLKSKCQDVEVLAEGERLPAHGKSVSLRREENPTGPRQGFEQVEAYHLVEEAGEVKLNQNESPWDVPEELKDAIFERMRDLPWNRYHQDIPEQFRSRLAEHNGLPSGQVFLGNGSNLVLQWIFETLGGPGRTALIPSPSFSLFRMWGRLTETRLKEFRLNTKPKGFEYPAEEIVRQIGKSSPELVILNLPNNPTGTEMTEPELTQVLDAVEKVGGWLVIDEAYREFSQIGYDRTEWIRQGRRVLILRTFSKALSAAGLRIGYLLTPESISEEFSKIVPPFHMNLFNAVAGEVMWDNAQVFIDRVEQLTQERHRMMETLDATSKVEPLESWANFFLFRTEDPDGLRQHLADKGILVRKLADDPALSGCLRVNVGTPEENDKFLQEVQAWLS